MRVKPLIVMLAVGASVAQAQTRVTLPTGTVFLVRTEQVLQSDQATVGQTFETTVVEDVSVNGYTVIPASSRIRGIVSYGQAATRAQSGVMQVNFNRLTLPTGTSYTIPVARLKESRGDCFEGLLMRMKQKIRLGERRSRCQLLRCPPHSRSSRVSS